MRSETTPVADGPKSASSARVPALHRVRYDFELFVRRLRSRPNEQAAVTAYEEVTELARIFEERSGCLASDAVVLEIGFGTRPFRALAMSGLFRRVVAVDLEFPVRRARDVAAVRRINGTHRAIKSWIRFALFDKPEWKAFHSKMRQLSEGYNPDAVELIVGDATAPEVLKRCSPPFDLVFSSDVFEHIEESRLERLLINLNQTLGPNGIVVTRPMVFTGISGGHDPHWYTSRVETNPSAGAWAHLWSDDFQVDTYLNRLSRLEYRDMFEGCGYSVEEDRAVLGLLGARHMDAYLRERLNRYDDYELFSNRVEFILRPMRE